MQKFKVKLSLYINYFVIGLMLNSVGIVILQVIIHYNVSEGAASVLEAFKDLSIAIFSFVLASYIPKYGYKRSMLTALLVVTVASLGMRFFDGFLMSKILFAATGFSFGLIKVSAYSTVGLVTENSDEHASVMSVLEGVFLYIPATPLWRSLPLLHRFRGIFDVKQWGFRESRFGRLAKHLLGSRCTMSYCIF